MSINILKLKEEIHEKDQVHQRISAFIYGADAG